MSEQRCAMGSNPTARKHRGTASTSWSGTRGALDALDHGGFQKMGIPQLLDGLLMFISWKIRSINWFFFGLPPWIGNFQTAIWGKIQHFQTHIRRNKWKRGHTKGHPRVHKFGTVPREPEGTFFLKVDVGDSLNNLFMWDPSHIKTGKGHERNWTWRSYKDLQYVPIRNSIPLCPSIFKTNLGVPGWSSEAL